ncbi:MAG: hypothetical protein MJB57_00395 [Gemmatimonadetes bacterium]|nr:hypothetical protein [Gemmatimonadota bacterium]
MKLRLRSSPFAGRATRLGGRSAGTAWALVVLQLGLAAVTPVVETWHEHPSHRDRHVHGPSEGCHDVGMSAECALPHAGPFQDGLPARSSSGTLASPTPSSPKRNLISVRGFGSRTLLPQPRAPPRT